MVMQFEIIPQCSKRLLKTFKFSLPSFVFILKFQEQHTLEEIDDFSSLQL